MCQKDDGGRAESMHGSRKQVAVWWAASQKIPARVAHMLRRMATTCARPAKTCEYSSVQPGQPPWPLAQRGRTLAQKSENNCWGRPAVLVACRAVGGCPRYLHPLSLSPSLMVGPTTAAATCTQYRLPPPPKAEFHLSVTSIVRQKDEFARFPTSPLRPSSPFLWSQKFPAPCFWLSLLRCLPVCAESLCELQPLTGHLSNMKRVMAPFYSTPLSQSTDPLCRPPKRVPHLCLALL